MTETDAPTPDELLDPWLALKAAAEDFVAKVERGEARSKRSYEAFVCALGDIAALSSATRPEPVAQWQRRFYSIDARPGHWENCDEPDEPTNLRPSRIIEYRALYASPAKPEPAPSEGVETDLIKRAVQRFLTWKLPDDFNPDGGITFKREFNENTPHPMKHTPSGTNLLDSRQAEAMVRHVLEGVPLRAPTDSGWGPSRDQIARLLLDHPHDMNSIAISDAPHAIIDALKIANKILALSPTPPAALPIEGAGR